MEAPAPLFPPHPPPPCEGEKHPVERLLAGGAGAAALALGVGRMLRMVERKEARPGAQMTLARSAPAVATRSGFGVACARLPADAGALRARIIPRMRAGLRP
jgi:hypothetical protein